MLRDRETPIVPLNFLSVPHIGYPNVSTYLSSALVEKDFCSSATWRIVARVLLS
jgi:hypothetical protein